MKEALGLIETKGLVGSIEAADAACKMADVKLLKQEMIGAAFTTVFIQGEVAAVIEAVKAGGEAAKRVGQLISTHVIPRPYDETDTIIFEKEK